MGNGITDAGPGSRTPDVHALCGLPSAQAAWTAACTQRKGGQLCRFLKGKNPEVQIVGLQPASESSIPGIRRWPPAYLPSIFDAARVDRVIDITQREAEECMRALARVEGIMAGVSSGGAVSAALRLAAEVRRCTFSAGMHCSVPSAS